MYPHRIIFWEVDVQADFMLPGGKLYVPGAEEIIPNIKRLVEAATNGKVLLVSSGDFHADADPEFKTFPPHCLRGTPGAKIIPQGMTRLCCAIPNDPSFEFPEDLSKVQQILIEKQTLDVFENPHANTLVHRLGARAEYFVFGVVAEYCVRCAAKGLLERGHKVAIVEDAIESLEPEEGRRTLDELRALGARLVTTNEALAEVQGTLVGRNA
jgi:nicotinamidase/pyrazinamidase